ncbi:MAG: hypothetical protein OXT06_02170 [Rhodospirillaceae bacterium]|nr:hypothetical protein [Rhodospirillaceae bacterium]
MKAVGPGGVKKTAVWKVLKRAGEREIVHDHNGVNQDRKRDAGKYHPRRTHQHDRRDEQLQTDFRQHPPRAECFLCVCHQRIDLDGARKQTRIGGYRIQDPDGDDGERYNRRPKGREGWEMECADIVDRSRVKV